MTSDSATTRQRPPPAVWWLLGALGAVLIGALAFGLPHFDNDLTNRAREALAGAGVPVQVHFDGRHGYLEGSLEYEEDVARAVSVVRDLRGVADVSAEVDFLIAGSRERRDPPPTAPPTTSPQLTLRFQDGIILLRGRLGSQGELDAIVAAAAAAFGNVNVRNELQVDAGLESPGWVGRLPDLMAALLDLPAGTAAFGAEGASVSGTVAAEATKSSIGAAVAAVVGPLVVNNRIDVITPAPPSLQATGAGGVVTLRGAMPDQVSIDRIVAAAEGLYGVGNVVNEFVVQPGVLPADWLDIAPGLLVHTVGLDPWQIDIRDGSMNVAGRGPADGSVQAAIDEFSSVGSGLNVDTGGLEVAAESVAAELTRLLEGSATFRPGSADLSTEATALLDEAVRLLNANPSTLLTVEGHTDSQGSEATNLALSEERADAVMAYLVDGGVSAARLTAIGYGEQRPIATNDTSEGRAQNRRIEFIVEEGTN